MSFVPMSRPRATMSTGLEKSNFSGVGEISDTWKCANCNFGKVRAVLELFTSCE
jgi:hypothetical protein